MLYRLQIDIEGRDDALALAALIREMGYEVNAFAREAQTRLPVHQTRAGKIILYAMSLDRTYTTEDAIIVLEEHGYSARTATPTLRALAQEGAIKKLSAGLYRKSATFGCTAPE